MNKKTKKKSISSRVDRKKKPVQAPKAPKCCGSPVSSEEILTMSLEDMNKVELLRTKLSLFTESIKIRDLQKEKLEWESAARTATLTQEKFSLESKLQSLKGQLTSLLEDLSPKYGVDLKKCSYDDATGVIRIVDVSDESEGDTSAT
jgi:hypothetical protein